MRLTKIEEPSLVSIEMNTSQINMCLQHVPGFIGTFPCNMIPRVERVPSIFVVNTARIEGSNKRRVVPGKHWVVLFIHKDRKCEYFDSFGMQPLQKDIVSYISYSCKKLKYNTQLLQDPLSRTCGVYCIDYIVQRSKGTSLKKYLAQFTSDTSTNDRLVVDRTTCLLSARRLSLRLNLKSLLA